MWILGWTILGLIAAYLAIKLVNATGEGGVLNVVLASWER
jgi:uncharacterized membrane protein YeaQ/YmgE (transglycosylase-associated protein family)